MWSMNSQCGSSNHKERKTWSYREMRNRFRINVEERDGKLVVRPYAAFREEAMEDSRIGKRAICRNTGVAEHELIHDACAVMQEVYPALLSCSKGSVILGRNAAGIELIDGDQDQCFLLTCASGRDDGYALPAVFYPGVIDYAWDCYGDKIRIYIIDDSMILVGTGSPAVRRTVAELCSLKHLINKGNITADSVYTYEPQYGIYRIGTLMAPAFQQNILSFGEWTGAKEEMMISGRKTGEKLSSPVRFAVITAMLRRKHVSSAVEELLQRGYFCGSGLNMLVHAEQNVRYHRETVWVHTKMCLDLAAKYKDLASNSIGFMWGTLFHDIGKPMTKTVKYRNGERIVNNIGHAEAGAEMVDHIRRELGINEGIARYMKTFIYWHDLVYKVDACRDERAMVQLIEKAARDSILFDVVLFNRMVDDKGKIPGPRAQRMPERFYRCFKKWAAEHGNAEVSKTLELCKRCEEQEKNQQNKVIEYSCISMNIPSGNFDMPED